MPGFIPVSYTHLFADEDRTNELRIGAQGTQRGHIVPFLDHQHHEGPDYRERGEHPDQQRNEENAPFLVGNQSEEEGVHLVAGADVYKRQQ